MGMSSGLARSSRAPTERRPAAAALVAEYLRNSLRDIAGIDTSSFTSPRRSNCTPADEEARNSGTNAAAKRAIEAVSDVSLAGRTLITAMADQEIIFTVEDAPEGGYVARALGYAIFTQGETLEELRQMVRDAVNCHFEKENKPRLIRLHMVKDEVIVV